MIYKIHASSTKIMCDFFDSCKENLQNPFWLRVNLETLYCILKLEIDSDIVNFHLHHVESFVFDEDIYPKSGLTIFRIGDEYVC